MSKRNVQLVITGLLSAGLIGCGGSSSSSGIKLEGVAADGYLNGATVCFDLNDNHFCDTNEPSTKTTAGGKFTLKKIGEDIKDAHSVVVEVTAKTTDEDTNAEIGSNYTLIAPPGKYSFISPISTQIVNLMEIKALSAADAESLLKQGLGFSTDEEIDLYADYIAKAKIEDSLQTRYQQLRQSARLMASILSINRDKITAALSALKDPTDSAPIEADRKNIDPNTKMKGVVRILGETVWSEIDRIRSMASSKLKGDFSSAELLPLSNATAVDTTDILNLVNTKEKQSASPLVTDFGSSSLDASTEFYRITDATNKTTFARFDRTFDGSHFTLTRNDYDGTAWNPNTTATPEFWMEVNTQTGDILKKEESTTSIQFDSKGYTATSVAGNIVQYLAEEKKLDGLTIAENTHLSGNNDELAAGNITDATAKFSTGAKYFIWIVKNTTDLYQFPSMSRDGACLDSSLTYTTGTMNCNQINTFDNAGTATLASSIDDVFASSDAEVKYLKLDDDYKVQLTRTAIGDTTGTAHLVTSNSTGSGISFIENTTWRLETFGTTQVVSIKLTAKQLVNRTHHESDRILAVIDGGVRQGYKVPKDTLYQNNHLTFNSTAKDDILAQFKF